MIDCSLYFSTICYVRLSKITAALLLPRCLRSVTLSCKSVASRLQCKGRAFPHSLQDFDEKKCEKNSFASILLLHSMAKSAVKPVFFASSPPYHFHPKTALFRPIQPLLGQKPPFSGCFSLQLASFSRPKSHFAPKKSV